MTMAPERLTKILRPGRWAALALIVLTTTLVFEVRRARQALDTRCLAAAPQANLDVLVDEGRGATNLIVRWSSTGEGRAEFEEESRRKVVVLDRERARALALRITEPLDAPPEPASQRAMVIVTLGCDGHFATNVLRASAAGGTYRASLFDCARGGALADSMNERFACARGWLTAKVSGPRDADARAGAIAQRVEATLEALRQEQATH
ncbi:MAG: hypothetical protein QM723_21750 [Myxococcaceae bacterium]